MDIINHADYDFSLNNHFYTGNSNYFGILYHYTDQNGCNGIFNPIDSNGNKIDLDSGCISLRFTRIEDVTRNDTGERQHIVAAIQDAINKLESDKYITQEFAKIVQDFLADDTGKNISFYTSASNMVDETFHRPVIKWDFGETDYYIACFSTDPNNIYIQERFNCPIRLVFRSCFSNPYEKTPIGNYRPTKFTPCGSTLYPYISPYSNLGLDQSRLIPQIKEVVYDEKEKCKIIEQVLLVIFHHYSCGTLSKDRLKNELQDMYSEYDALFKMYRNSENEYWREKEVRFIIKINRDTDPDSLKQYKIILDNKIEQDGKTWYKFLYLPVDKRFLMGGGGCV